MVDRFAHPDSMAGVGEAEIRREKEKARSLRKTRWWQQKIGAGRCYYCGARVAPGELTMDHVMPLALGGKSVKNNLVACCKACNTKKKLMHPLEWQQYLDKLLNE